MDPTISFPEEYYTVGIAVTSCMLVGIVVFLLTWRLIHWIRERRSRDHLPLTSSDGDGGGSKSIQKVLDTFFCRDTNRKLNLSDQFNDQHLDNDDNSETSCLKRSSTVHSRTSLISSGSSSHRSSIPPVIVQSCLPQDITIPERRPSCLSVESGGVELGQVQADCYKSEMSEKRFKKVGDQSLINEEEEEYEDDASSPSSQEKDNNNENGDSCVGKLMFSLEHDMHRESLTVVVMKISDLRLPASDGSSNIDQLSKDSTSSGGSRESVTSITSANQQQQQQQLQQLFDPYVRVVLLPEGKQKAKTRVVRRTKNPIFEETFTFYGISSQKLQQTIIKFTVMTHDRFSKDTCMGHVILAMTQKLVKRDRQAVTICKTIRSGSEPAQKQGELFISLNFDSSTDKLTVIVLKGKNFPRMDIAGLADPYVKIYLMCDGQRIDKKKTQVKKRTLNPVFNETFHFNLPSHHLRQQQQKDKDTKCNSPGAKFDYSTLSSSVTLKFIVLDWDRVSKNEVIGVVQIGPDVVSDVAVKHWNDVMECPRKQLAVWHKLL